MGRINNNIEPVLIAVDILISHTGLQVIEINDRAGGIADALPYLPASGATVAELLAERMCVGCRTQHIAFVLGERFGLQGGTGRNVELMEGDLNARETIGQINTIADAFLKYGARASFYSATEYRTCQASSESDLVYLRANNWLPRLTHQVFINSFETRALCMSKLNSYRALLKTPLKPYLVPTFLPGSEPLAAFLDRWGTTQQAGFVVKFERGARGLGIHLLSHRRIAASARLRQFIEAGRLIVQPFVTPRLFVDSNAKGYVMEARLYFVDGVRAGLLFKRAPAPFSTFGTETPLAWMADGACTIAPERVFESGLVTPSLLGELALACEEAITLLGHQVRRDAQGLCRDYLAWEARNARLRKRARAVRCAVVH